MWLVNRWRLGCVYRVCLPVRRTGSRALKRNCIWTEKREARLKQRNFNMSLFLSNGSVKDNRKILLCKKSGGNSGTVHIQDKTARFRRRYRKQKQKTKSSQRQCLTPSDKACTPAPWRRARILRNRAGVPRYKPGSEYGRSTLRISAGCPAFPGLSISNKLGERIGSTFERFTGAE